METMRFSKGVQIVTQPTTNTIGQAVQRFIALYDAEEFRLANAEHKYGMAKSEIRERATEYALQNLGKL